MNTESSEFCSLQQDPCELSGTYDANSSSTYTYINSVFSISYVDGSQAAGDYVADTFGIGGVELEDLQFAIGYTSTSQEGVMGIGYPSNEVQVLLAFGRPYPNIPELLAQRGFINSNAYSLWLNDLDANTGVILFGGVDTAKYVGELHTLPVVRRRGEYTDLIISMTGLGRGDSPGSIRTDIREHALLDSGASFTYLPADITADLYRSLGAQYDSQTGEALVDCSLAEDSNTLDFTFTTATIAVPLNELVLPVGSLPNGQRVCVLGKPVRDVRPNQRADITQVSVQHPNLAYPFLGTLSCEVHTLSTILPTTRYPLRKPTSMRQRALFWRSQTPLTAFPTQEVWVSQLLHQT